MLQDILRNLMFFLIRNLMLDSVLSSGLDVVRTDRTLVFYEKQANLSKLWDILAVYAWIDTDVGYCQGWLERFSSR